MICKKTTGTGNVTPYQGLYKSLYRACFYRPCSLPGDGELSPGEGLVGAGGQDPVQGRAEERRPHDGQGLFVGCDDVLGAGVGVGGGVGGVEAPKTRSQAYDAHGCREREGERNLS